MSGYLLDTNVISEYTRAQLPDERVRRWIDAQDEGTLHLSVLTFGEIRKGVDLLPQGAKRQRLDEWLSTELTQRFRGRVLPITLEITLTWGMLDARAQTRGRRLAVVDGLLAATAILHDLSVVTRNVKDFGACGVELLNPWQGPH